MPVEQLPNFPTADSILFLGSGFSCNAINIRGQTIPTGEELKGLLAQMLTVDHNAYDFQTLAEEINFPAEFEPIPDPYMNCSP